MVVRAKFYRREFWQISLMDECAGMEYFMSSADAMTSDSVFSSFCERVPDLKSLMSVKGTACVRGTGAFAASRTDECEEKPHSGGSQSGTPLHDFTDQERALRDFERTVIGNEVKWICTIAPTTPKCSEIPLNYVSEDSMERSGGCGGFDHITDSPTSALTADTYHDNFCGTIANYGLDSFSRVQSLEAIDKTYLDASGSFLSALNNGHSLFEPKPINWSPVISPDFEAACSSSYSCASDLQWSVLRELADVDRFIFQEPRGSLGPLPILQAEQMQCHLPGLPNSLEIVAAQETSGLASGVGSVEKYLSSDTAEEKEERGVELVQTLVACAHAIAVGELDTAQLHLRRLALLISPKGNSMERVATYLTRALAARVDRELRGCAAFDIDSYAGSSIVEQKLIAYRNFYSSCPYLIVTHFTANQAILEAFEGEEKVHIVDLDIKQGVQWPSLIQALSVRPMGPPQLRITGVGGDTVDMNSLIATKKRLLDFADVFNVPLEFTVIKHKLECLEPWMLELRHGETLAVNCVSALHKLVGHPTVSIHSFLLMIHSLEPTVFTIVEEDADHDQEFLPRFLNALHYYSSMFDSLAASCSSLEERENVERLLLGTDMMDIVGREGQDRLARHQTADVWIRLMTHIGFRLRPLSSRSIIQANCLLNMYPDSKYCLTSQESFLSIGWQDKPLYYVSSWCLSNNN